jgi:4-carboxymuconolactone decarboxylase
MRFHLFCIGALILAGTVTAQTPTTPDLHLRGDRFKPLTYGELTPEQKTLADHVLAGERASLAGPYNVLLRSPEMGDLAQKFGAYMRYHSSLSDDLQQLAILLTSRYWNAQFEWYSHHDLAIKSGLSQKTIDTLAEGKKPAGMTPEQDVAYTFCTEMLHNKQVSDATFHAAVDKLGERRVVDLVGVMGYYHFVSMILNLDRYPLPDGVKPPLKPLH